MAQFPAEQYASKRDKWLGYNAIVLPTVESSTRELIGGKRVLDIGCGNGHFSRKFLEWAAEAVLGIDNCQDMIRKCEEGRGSEKRLSYSCVGIDEFETGSKFHVATALFVFQFLESKELLAKALKNTFAALEQNGVLVAIVPNGVKEYNPCPEEGRKFGAAAAVPSEALRDGLPMTINFYNDDVISGSSTIHFYFRETYEQLLREAGFRRVEWSDPRLDEDYVREYGREYFESYMSPPKDVVLKAFK